MAGYIGPKTSDVPVGTIGTGTVSTNSIVVGSNVSITPSTITIGNSTVNSIVNSSTIFVGANVYLTFTQLSVGNSTVNTSANSTGLFINGIQAHEPAGKVAFFAQNTAPTGWVKANGSALSRTTYATLFASIGTTFGNTTSSDFKVPDMRGYFPRGWDDSAGVDSGRAFGSTQADELKSHNHYMGPYGVEWPGSGTCKGDASYAGYYSGSTGGTETRPKNVALLACIKY